MSSQTMARAVRNAKAEERKRILEIIKKMRRNLKNPDYSYSNGYIENWMELFKMQISREEKKE